MYKRQIQYNPVEIANNLRRNNGSIPGFRPGKPTSDFITRTLNKITLIGAIFLAVVAVLPIVLGNLTGMSIQLGGTSLLIVVGVAPVSYTHLSDGIRSLGRATCETGGTNVRI